jgi:hypothetical protein
MWQSNVCSTICAILFAMSYVQITYADPLKFVQTDTSEKINADRDAAKIESGRPENWKAASADYSLDKVKKWADAHKAKNGSGFRYVYIPVDQVNNKEMANTLRVATGKIWNHLSWQKELSIPEDISGGAGLAFALNASKIWGADADRNWNYIANCSPKANISISPASRRGCSSFDSSQPAPIPRFIFNAVNGGPYANIHKTPGSFNSFKQKFKLGSIKHNSTHKEAIVCGPRITTYRTVTYNGEELVYAFSTDEFNGRDGGDIRYKSAPTERDQRNTGAMNAAPGNSGTAVASEWWMQLPNGFLYWGIHGEGSQERGRAESPFAIDPANWTQNWELQTGRSCITCHSSGIQSAISDKEFAGKDGWTSNEELSAFYLGLRNKFQNSMRIIVSAMSDGDTAFNDQIINGTIEPTSRAIMLIEGPFPGNRNCAFFCRGKYGAQRQNLCSTLPAR